MSGFPKQVSWLESNNEFGLMGGYRFIDYVKVGLPLTLLFLAVSLVLVPMIWPL